VRKNSIHHSHQVQRSPRPEGTDEPTESEAGALGVLASCTVLHSAFLVVSGGQPDKQVLVRRLSRVLFAQMRVLPAAAGAICSAALWCTPRTT